MRGRATQHAHISLAQNGRHEIVTSFQALFSVCAVGERGEVGVSEASSCRFKTQDLRGDAREVRECVV
jgi:hypothetical protein